MFHLVFEWKGPGAESEEKREPVSDIDTGVVDSLKVLVPQAVMPLPPRRGGTFVRLIPKKGPSPETLPSGE